MPHIVGPFSVSTPDKSPLTCEDIPMTTQPPERSAQRSRILSPDIARGIALLGIALANVATAWLPADSSLEANRLGGMVTGSLWEQIAVVFSAMFIHVRGLPMFSAMLGY